MSKKQKSRQSKRIEPDWRETGGWTVPAGEKIRVWAALCEMLLTGHMIGGLASELCVWQRGDHG